MVTGASLFHVDVVVPTLRANVESSKYEKERSRMRRYMLRLEIAAKFLALLLLACVWSHTWFDFVIILAPTVGFWYFVISRVQNHWKRCFLEFVVYDVVITVSLYAFFNYLIVPDVANKVMVIYCKEAIWPPGLITQGLFSATKHVLGALVFAEKHGAAGVKVNFVDEHYSDAAMDDNNYWGYFYNPTMPMKEYTERPLGDLEEVHFNRKLKRYGLWGGFNNLIDGVTPSTYPITYGTSRSETNRLIREYLIPNMQPELKAKLEMLHVKMFKDADVILGVHYRGTDTSEHYPYTKIQYETFYRETKLAIKEMITEKNLEASTAKVRIFVASDEAEFLEGMQAQFPGQVVFHDESPRLLPHQFAAATEGLTNSPDVHVSNYQKGETAIIDAICLAAGEYLIKGRSNLSEFSYAFNPSMRVTQIFGDHKDITYIPKYHF